MTFGLLEDLDCIREGAIPKAFKVIVTLFCLGYIRSGQIKVKSQSAVLHAMGSGFKAFALPGGVRFKARGFRLSPYLVVRLAGVFEPVWAHEALEPEFRV